MESSIAPDAVHYSYVEDESDFPSELICTVCHDVAGTHTACPGCSQTFCQNCVHKWFNTQKSNAQGPCTCPYCRRKLKFSDLKHDAAIQQQLDQLQVYCPNKQAGCNAVIPRSKVSRHLSRDCWAQQCSCKFCSKTGLRKDIRPHETSECLERSVPCSNAAAGCSATVPLSILQDHLDYMCSMQLCACPQCGAQVVRSLWHSHLEHSCPSKQPCPLRMYGCSYSGSAEQVQQHCQQCPCLQRRQQLEQQLSAGQGVAAAQARAQAVLAQADASELPCSSARDCCSVFGAPNLRQSAAHACQLLLQAVPQSALPPRTHQQDNWLVNRVNSVQQLNRPASLASITAPRQIPDIAAENSSTVNASAVRGSPSVGLTAADALALGAPGCFNALGLESGAWLESAWRILLNVSMIDALSSDLSDLAQLPSSFALYTAVCRAWDTVSRILGPVQQHSQQQGQQGQQGQSSNGTDNAAATAAASRRGSSSNSSSSSGSEGGDDGSIYLPGLERGLFEDECEDLEGWLWQQRDMLKAVATVTGRVLNLWLGIGLVAFEPDHAVELHELQEMGTAAIHIIGEVASTKKTSRRAHSSSGTGAANDTEQAQQQQRQVQQVEQTANSEDHHAAPGATRRLLGWWFNAVRGAAADSMPSNAEASAHDGSHQTAQQPNGTPAAAADTTTGAASATGGPADDAHLATYSAALQKLQQLGSGLAVPLKRSIPPTLHSRTPAEALELATAVLILDHVRQQHIEISMIPETTPLLMHGFRGYWAPSILAGSRAWLPGHLKLSWQAVAVLNDMLTGLSNQFLRVIGEGFFEPETFRVPMSPQLALAAAQLVLPPSLLAGCLDKVAAFSRAYHDEECDDLAEVAWNTLQLRLGMTIELDKVVALVDERLPVQVYTDEEDEDEESYSGDEQSDSADDSGLRTDEGNDQTDSEYTTDDEYMQEAANEAEQQQRLLPAAAAAVGADATASGSNSSTEARQRQPQQREDGSSASGDDGSGGSESSWESAGSDDEALAPAAAAAAAAAGSSEVGSAGKLATIATAASCGAAAEQSGAAVAAATAAGVDSYRASMSLYLQQLKEQQQLCQTLQRSAPADAAAAAGPDVEMTQEQQQQQFSNAQAGAEVAVPAAAGTADQPSGPLWFQELSANLQQLANTLSSDLPHLEQRMVQDAAAAFASGLPADTPAVWQQQQQQQQQNAGHVLEGASESREAPEQQQQQSEDKEEAGDTTTHGVVILAGFMEVVLQQLLSAAAEAAEHDSAVLAAAAAAEHDSAVLAAAAAGGGTDMQVADEAIGGAVSQQRQQIHISARHVLLAANANADLKLLLLDRTNGQPSVNRAAVAWAGVAPDHNSSFQVPNTEHDPLTAWLYSLASGTWQQQDTAATASSSSSNTDTGSVHRFLFPADLRLYCGNSCQLSSSGDDAATAASHSAAAAAAAAAGGDAASRGCSVVCCFVSGWQCSKCAAATAALQYCGLDEQLDTLRDSLRGVAVQANSAAGVMHAMVLTDAQLDELIDVTRLYHLQQQWWYNSSDKVHKSGHMSSSSDGAVLGWTSLAAVDQVQIADIQEKLQPLRDVVALREIQLQQTRDGQIWPAGHFEGLVHDALGAVAAQKRQQKALQLQMQQLVAPSSSSTAAAASSMRESDDDSASDDVMDIDAEALDVLAAAAEDFLVQQFRAANELALHAGRQEVQPHDLRLALASNGYRDLLQGLPHAG